MPTCDRICVIVIIVVNFLSFVCADAHILGCLPDSSPLWMCTGPGHCHRWWAKCHQEQMKGISSHLLLVPGIAVLYIQWNPLILTHSNTTPLNHNNELSTNLMKASTQLLPAPKNCFDSLAYYPPPPTHTHTVDLDNATRENNNVYLIVPPVSKLVFKSVNRIAYVSNGNSTVSFLNVCTLCIMLLFSYSVMRDKAHVS